ncbi:MAG TPA: hypothetical protein ENF20_03310 [Candidatus Marinimicrobia bacterium]|nr:hypothetical protein [Candidatus Neomarinimicrobiota bacterium]
MPRKGNIFVKIVLFAIFIGVLFAGYFVYRYNFGYKLQKLVYKYDYVVVSYNMGHGINFEGYYTIVSIARLLRALSPDIVFLYDVDVGVERSFGDDQVRKIAAGLGMEYTFGKLEKIGKGWNGFAVLTKYPIVFSELKLERGIDGEIAAGILHVILRLNNKRTHIYSVYFKKDSSAFETSFRELMDLVVKRGVSKYTIIASDFYVEPSQKIIDDFKYYFRNTSVKCAGECYNYPSVEPTMILDYIFVGEGFDVLSHRVFDADICKSAGRYLPVVCRLKMKLK